MGTGRIDVPGAWHSDIVLSRPRPGVKPYSYAFDRRHCLSCDTHANVDDEDKDSEWAWACDDGTDTDTSRNANKCVVLGRLRRRRSYDALVIGLSARPLRRVGPG